jgi:TonB family protein
MNRRLAWLSLFLFPALALASTTQSSGRVTQVAAGGRIATGAVHLVNFSPLEEADVKMQCASSQAPRAVYLPHATFAEIPDDAKVVINLIIGSDGEVYSPFVVNGVGSPLDRKLVETVRHWHYRPALCNGVPTDAEVKIELSSR